MLNIVNNNNLKFSQAVRKIYSEDLNSVVDRLVRVEKWKLGEALNACKLYRNYMVIKLKYGMLYELPPSKDIDDVWHNHILHTENYVNFCYQVFGRFLHHNPHHQNWNKLSYDRQVEIFENQTQFFYFNEFGEYIYDVRKEECYYKPMSLFAKIKAIFSKKIIKN